MEKNEICAPMPGTITDIRVKEGDVVVEGQVLFVYESMKMENEVIAKTNGTIGSIHAKKGDVMEKGQKIIIML
jgi:biotin carboxyl carrier protein